MYNCLHVGFFLRTTLPELEAELGGLTLDRHFYDNGSQCCKGRTLIGSFRESLPPRLKLRLRTIAHPVRTWKANSHLRALYPASWRWIALSQNIQGFLTVAEADELYRLARDFTPNNSPVAVELGSWKGKSSVMLAGGLLGKIAPRLFCVDPFGCDESLEYQKKYYDPLLQQDPRDLQAVFKSNMRSCGADHIAVPLKSYSFELCSGWSHAIDLLFIDANHEYESVLRDFNDWFRFVKKGGVVALHDVGGEFEGPLRVVAEKLKPPLFDAVRLVDSLAWGVKTGS